MSGATCDRVRAALPGYLGDELPSAELDLLGAHLRECGGCRREAGRFLQAQKALQRAAAGSLVGDGVDDDALQEGLHAAILTRIRLERCREEAAPPWAQRLMIGAAAVLLAAFGFWLAGRSASSSIWDRPATRSIGPEHVVGSPLQALPFVGPPVDLRPVGLDDGIGGSAANGFGPGMLGRSQRSQLRDLVAEEFVLPQQPR